MTQNITSLIDLSELVDDGLHEADAMDVKIPLLDMIDVVNDALNGAQAHDAALFAEIATPATPTADHHKIYFKSDGKFYRLNDAGTEVEVGANGAQPYYDFDDQASAPSNPASGFGRMYYDADKTLRLLDNAGNNRLRIAGKATRSGTQSIAHNTIDSTTVITFTAETIDTDNMINTAGANPTRITIVTAGLYFIAARTRFAGSAGGSQRQVRINVNGSNVESGDTLPLGTLATSVSTSVFLVLAAGAYVEMQAYQESGGALNVDVSSMTVVRLG